jgi:type VI secretion system protein ImpA
MSATIPPYTVDFEKLLTPISADHPAGDSLRYDGTYDRVREARREDDPRLTQGIYQTDVKRADWAAVEAACLEALAERTKDLQLGCWLLEAWLHLYGFAGVREGVGLLAGLCENFWEDLHPQPEGGDLEGRVAPVVWVDEKLSHKLKLIPLSAPQAGEGPGHTLADWESACQLDNLSKKNPKAGAAAEAQGAVTLAKFQTGVMLTPRSFYAELLEDLEASHDACVSFERLLEARCGAHAPGLYKFREVVLSTRALVSGVLSTRADEPGEGPEGPPDPQAGAEDEGGATPARAADAAPPHRAGGAIRNRADAYRRLEEAADYLLQTEPHSPVPYLVKRAVAWGGMNLFDLMQQIIRNDGEMQELDRLLRLSNREDL